MDYHKEGEPVFLSFNIPFKPNAARTIIMSGTKITTKSDMTGSSPSLIGTVPDISCSYRRKDCKPNPN